MLVTVTRTNQRGYAVRVAPVGAAALEMNPAPSYDELLPHDVVHFVVEDELGLAFGIFGQLAAGGNAGTFRLVPGAESSRDHARSERRLRERGERLHREGRKDTDFSERAATICHHAWLARSTRREDRERARTMSLFVEKVRSECSAAERASLSEETVQRICDRLDELSARWVRLTVGQALELHWKSPRDVARRRDRVSPKDRQLSA